MRPFNADSYLVFDATTALWSRRGRAGSVQFDNGLLMSRCLEDRARMVMVAGTVNEPRLEPCMALDAEYRAVPMRTRMRTHHLDVLLLKKEPKSNVAVCAIVFFRRVRCWRPNLDVLRVNLQCLCWSLDHGQLDRSLYLDRLRRVEILTPVRSSSATVAERAAAAALVSLQM